MIILAAVFYAVVTMIFLCIYAIFCRVSRARFVFWPALFLCAIWPITAPFGIHDTLNATRNFPGWPDRD